MSEVVVSVTKNVRVQEAVETFLELQIGDLNCLSNSLELVLDPSKVSFEGETRRLLATTKR